MYLNHKTMQRLIEFTIFENCDTGEDMLLPTFNGSVTN